MHESPFPKLNNRFRKSRDQNMAHNEHISVIFCLPEVAGDVISICNVKIIDDNFVMIILKLLAIVVSDVYLKIISCRRRL